MTDMPTPDRPGTVERTTGEPLPLVVENLAKSYRVKNAEPFPAVKGISFAIAAAAVLLIGSVTGDFRALGALAALPVVFLGALLFASLGLLAAAWAASIDEISYPQFLFIFPMFLFCGVFFPLSQLPEWWQPIVWVLPLTPVVSLLRSLTLGTPVFWRAVPILLIWLVTAVRASRRRMLARLIK